jgi:hypothetical protein
MERSLSLPRVRSTNQTECVPRASLYHLRHRREDYLNVTHNNEHSNPDLWLDVARTKLTGDPIYRTVTKFGY